MIFREVALKKLFNELHESEEYMTPKVLPFLIIMSFMSGFIGQMFGLGGGFVYGPMLLASGVNPLVSASTCLYMIMFSNSSSLIMFAIFGRLNIYYTLFLGVFTGTGVMMGVCITKVVMTRFKRASFVAIALGIVCCISTSISIVSSIISLKS